MPANAAYKFYDDYSSSNASNIFKLDSFIKNPAPPQVPLTEMMKKVGALMTNGL